jgi:predicted RND superfamily exporter protein
MAADTSGTEGGARGLATAVVGALVRGRLWIAAAAVAVALLGSAAMTRTVVSNDLDVWFVDDDPALLTYLDFRRDLGSDEVLLLAWRGDEEVASASRLTELGSLSRALATVDGIERVFDLSRVAVADTSDGQLAVSRVVAGDVGEDDVARARAALDRRRSPARLVGKDGRTSVVYVWLAATEDLDARRSAILDDVRATLDEVLGARAVDVRMAGGGLVYDAMNQLTLKDGALFIALAYLLVLLALWFATRSVRWTLVAVLAVSFADWTLFGAMAALGIPLNAVTISLPTIVMVLGVAHVIHLSTHAAVMERPLARDPRALAAAASVVVIPCVFNALTTSAGFFSLGTASMGVTREYGIFAGLGVLLALGFSLALFFVALPGALERSKARGRPARSRLAVALVSAAVRRPGRVLTGAALVFALAFAGATRVDVDTYTIGFLPADHAVRVDDRWIEREIGPYVPLELIVRAPAAGGWRTAAIVGAIDELQRDLERAPDFGASFSVVDVIAEATSALRPVDGTDAAGQVPAWPPASDAAVSDAWGLLNALDANVAAGLVTRDDRGVRLTIGIPMGTATELSAFAARARELASRSLPEGVTVEVTGYLPLYGAMVSTLVEDQARSFGLAFALVLLLLFAALRSGRLVAVAVLPNLLPVVAVLGVMGAAGIRLDVATVTVAAALLGIVVDDSVHVLYRFKHELGEGRTVEDALIASARSAGAAILATTAVLSLGFFVLGLASIKTVAWVGVLSGVGVVAALLADLLLLPALARLVFRDREAS